MNGNIFNIQRFCTSDGPGIRTTVFLKGCPLKCSWCHNPESRLSGKSMFFDANKCIGCGYCFTHCPNGVHQMAEDLHILDREKCALCGKCSEGCYSGAIEICGIEKSTDEILEEVFRDNEFYKNSGGGLTISGGEPLYQPNFTIELSKKAKEKSLHVCIETSGFGSLDKLIELSKYVDIFLFDIKCLDEKLHKTHTGVELFPILNNLKALDESGAKTILRCPIIPDVNLNEYHFNELSKLSNSLKNVLEINLEPYHPLGIDKSKRLGINQEYDNKDFLNAKDIEAFMETLKENVTVPVKIS